MRLSLLGVAILGLVASTASADTITLAWDRNPETFVAGYKISYGTQSGNYTTTVDVGNQTSYTINALADGQRYYFVVYAYTSSGVMSPPSAEVSGPAVALVSLTSSNTYPAPTGAPVTWKAVAGPAGGSLQYQFWRFSQSSGTWTMVQDYSSSNTYTWTPSAAEQGTYALQVWARLNGSTASYDTFKSSGMFTIANTIQVGSLETDTALPASVGTQITWKAKAIGGPAPLQYQFWRQNPAGQWSLVCAYSTSSTCSWTPGSSDVGQNSWQVWVRANGSTAAYDAWRSSGLIKIQNAQTAVATLTADRTFPSGTNVAVTWTAKAAGGPGPLQYQFWRQFPSGGSWSMVQDYSTSNTYTWTPTTTGSGNLQVWVRKQGSTASYESWAGATFQIANNTPMITSFTSDQGAAVGVNRPVTWTVNATGGAGQLQYSFWLYNQARDVWTNMQAYSTSNTMTWTPSAGDVGPYTLQAWVKRASSSAAYETYAASAFSVTAGLPAAQSVTANVASATVGMPITWTANVSAGSGQVEYRFWLLDQQRQVWTIVQDYSWESTFSWVPQAGDQGSYLLQVWVRSAGSTASYESFASSVPIVIGS
jgi:N-acetylmuramoyl-L-alanine amidase